MSAPRSLIDELIDEREDAAPWMVTYADMMTLLLVFFILLYSVFYFQTERFKRDLARVQIEIDDKGTTVNVLEYAASLGNIEQAVRLEEATGLREKRTQLLRDIRELAGDNSWDESVTAQVVGDKLMITLDGAAVFGSGSVDFTDQASSIFDNMIETFGRYPDYRINISGHTDDVPISNASFTSNWELSAVRATSVLRYFSQRGVDARRLTATGYADLFPIASNETAAGRAKNRRVEFVLEKETD